MSATVGELSARAFDYVVIGGGTAGLTIASRLAENAAVSVALLEAGPENLNEPLIKVPAQFGKQFGNPKFDWGFETVPQKYCNGRKIGWSRGKTLGGSSAINFYHWSKPPAQDIDAWEKLGNTGWNWKQYSINTKNVEKFTPPKAANVELYRHFFNPDAHGTTGPLQTSFPEIVMAGESLFHDALLKVGINRAKDPLNGDPIGVSMGVCTLDPKAITRTYSVTAFYEPNKDKHNFRVLCDALALRIVTNPSVETSSAEVEASGVEFEYQGEVHTVYVKKGVILSAGALKSPQLLELSGIGDRRVLEPLGIKTLVDLPGVGENMQEHILCSVAFELDQSLGYETLDALSDKVYAALQLSLHAQGKGIHRLGLGSFLFAPLASIMPTPDLAEELIKRQRRLVEEKLRGGFLSPSLKVQYELQLQGLENGKGADCEIALFPSYYSSAGKPEVGKAYISLIAFLNHPFSRGTIHVTSKDPHVHAAMDPHCFEDDFDLVMIREMMKFIRRMAEVEPFKTLITKEVAPGANCITNEEIMEHIRDNVQTVFHTASTTTMLPRSLDGVVAPDLLVHGTKNVRIADLGIVPLHIGAHTQATAYAIGERAAEIIKVDACK